MRAIGLDYGEKKIGVAVSDALGYTASGIAVIQRKPNESTLQSLNKLKEIVEQYEAELFVLGLPKNMNNTLGKRAEETMAFKKVLEDAFKIPVILWDERLSSVSAERVLIEADLSRKKRKNIIDKIAAAFILQNYLDFQGR